MPVSTHTYTEGIGRRKTAVARVRVKPAAKAAFSIAERDVKAYFPTDDLQKTVFEPLAHVEPAQLFEVSVHVRGGGIHAQAEAVRMGLARAMTLLNAAWKPAIKKAGLLTRDAREKERRKFGLKKARKAPQWSKR